MFFIVDSHTHAHMQTNTHKRKNVKKIQNIKCQNMQVIENGKSNHAISKSITPLQTHTQFKRVKYFDKIFTYSVVRHFCTLIDSVNPFENLFFKCCVEPRHLNSPFTIIASRVHSASHSSILCDVSTIDFPLFRTFDTMFHRLRFAPGSMPVVGSSSFAYE